MFPRSPLMISFFKHLGMVALALLPILSSAALQTGKVQVGKITGSVSIIDRISGKFHGAITPTSGSAV